MNTTSATPAPFAIGRMVESMNPAQFDPAARRALEAREPDDRSSLEHAEWRVEMLQAVHGLGEPTARALVFREGSPHADPTGQRVTEETVESPAARMRREADEAYQRESQLIAADVAELESARQARLAEASRLEAEEQAARDREAAAVQAEAAQILARVVQVRTDDRDRKAEALSQFLAGQPDGYPSIRQAFTDVTGLAEPGISEWRYAHGLYDSALDRAHESIDTATWSQVFGDAVTRRLVTEYATLPGLQTWRYLTTTIRTNVDYRTLRATRFGGYGQIPTVAQGAPFQPLTTPDDEEATYAVTKRGGTEELTFEAFVNNDPAPFAAVPVRLARAAANTLNRAVLDVFTTNAAIYDSVALFDAAHTNTAATALSLANLTARRTAMRKQTAYGDSTEVLGAVPRFLLVAPELEETANGIVTQYAAPINGDATSVGLREPLDLVVVPHWSSATAWFVVANPRSVPTFEVAFTGATPDPDVVINNSPDTDAITIKLRHAWGITVVDYRGFQRGNT